MVVKAGMVGAEVWLFASIWWNVDRAYALGFVVAFVLMYVLVDCWVKFNMLGSQSASFLLPFLESLLILLLVSSTFEMI